MSDTNSPPQAGPRQPEPETVIDPAFALAGIRPIRTGALGEEGPLRADRFEVLEEMGRGAMGIVYLAYDRLLEREVAVKTAAPGAGPHPAVAGALLREARMAAALDHAGIVRVHDFGEAGGWPYLVLSRAPGRSLHERWRHRDATWRNRVGAVLRVAGAMAHAHSRGVVHCDLKPSNLMQDTSGDVVVIDFGLAFRVGDVGEAPGGPGAVGTPPYLAPEQVDPDAGRKGPATDVYALGAILYEALTGARPFPPAVLPVMLEATLHDDPEPPSRVFARVPAELEELCLRALAKDPAGRPADAGVFEQELTRGMRRCRAWCATACAVTRRLPVPPTVAAIAVEEEVR